MLTFQDYQRAIASGRSVESFVMELIQTHKDSEIYKTAVVADLYDRQKNKTINEYVRMLFTMAGTPVEDFTASNNKIASNFFHRLNTQRCTYSLGNGVYFANDKDGKAKEQFGESFDHQIFDAGFYSLIHAISFGFWNVDKLHIFKVTEFAPLWDEVDGTLKAGVRFWQIDESKPMIAVFYEMDGYTRMQTYKKEKKNGLPQEYDYELRIAEEKRPYRQTVKTNEAGDIEVIGETTYSDFPIVPFWGSKLRQSTLVGMQQAIDSYDLIRSGFANDLTDCAEIYWLISNYGGMTEEDLARFRDRMKVHHIVEVPGEGDVKPYTQDIPYSAREAYLKSMREEIYENFGGLDVHQVNADSTNDHLEAAYQPMDENADDFEYQCIEFIQQIMVVAGVEKDTPIFKRNRISNIKEQVEVVLSEAEYLDEETILNKLPNITPDEVQEILMRKDAEDRDRMMNNPFTNQNQKDEDEEGVES